MGGPFEKLNLKSRISQWGAYLIRGLKRPLALSWLAFFILILGAFSLTLILPYQAPITPSTTIALTSPAEEKKAVVVPPPPPEPAFKKYAQPMSVPNGAAVISLIISDLGLDDTQMTRVKQMFSKEVAFALSSGTLNIAQTIKDLRTEGREVILMVPMEPLDYPQSDPGPNSLLTSLNPEDNVGRLKSFLQSADGALGITNFMGEAFVRSVEHVRPILTLLKEDGYLVIDTTPVEKSEISPLATELGMQNLLVKVQIIDDLTDIKPKWAQLSDIESLAKRDGSIVVYASSLPKNLEILSKWINGLNEKGILLAPLSFAAHYKAVPQSDTATPAPH